jgi:putative transposase
LKKERVKKHIYQNRELAVEDITEYIDFYNRTRRHSHLGGISPEQFEATQKSRRRAVQ